MLKGIISVIIVGRQSEGLPQACWSPLPLEGLTEIKGQSEENSGSQE